ncbi:MAG: hypothetical protein EP332_08390 [Bacteroidetes bacterium]|nr:MAG: hypothetical protein EP332_08390 [Bacteroidota bacterium]
MKHLSLFVFALVFLTACSDEKERKSEETNIPAESTASGPSAGVLVPALPLSDFPDQSYALYLPKSWNDQDGFNAIVFLDPHANGQAPLEIYRHLADSFNTILVGSNSIRNGQTFPVSGTMLNNLIKDVQSKYKLSSKPILSGFSGGAKVALSFAMQSNIERVIYCGAVAPIGDKDSLRLLGFAGLGDMNYADLVAFDLAFRNTKIQNTIIEWKGDHNYPGADIYVDAFTWIAGQTIPDLAAKKPSISQEELLQEQSIKSKYYQAFKNQESLEWWTQEIGNLNELAKQDMMYSRVLGFIGLACYSYTSQNLKSGNRQQAIYFVKVYEMATPNNPDMRAFKQQLGLN